MREVDPESAPYVDLWIVIRRGVRLQIHCNNGGGGVCSSSCVCGWFMMEHLQLSGLVNELRDRLFLRSVSKIGAGVLTERLASSSSSSLVIVERRLKEGRGRRRRRRRWGK